MRDGDIKLTTIKQSSEKQGFLLAKEDTIKCANCNKSLIQVLQVKEDTSIITSIVVECPYCSDTSFRYKISGKIYLQATEGNSIDTMPMDIKDGIRYTRIKVIKNE
jgi:DNA-directed RNA polymerase subunit RPC12/RpoP